MLTYLTPKRERASQTCSFYVIKKYGVGVGIVVGSWFIKQSLGVNELLEFKAELKVFANSVSPKQTNKSPFI